MAERRETLELLFEGAPRFVGRLDKLDAASVEELLDRAQNVALGMPEDEQIELIDAHPRIGAPPGSISALSYGEQGYERERGTPALAARLARLNDEYEQRFGFRFVIYVNGRSRAEIAEIIEHSLDADRAAEKRRALIDVVEIARSRHARTSQEQPT
jgi:2-oxo-4-hydroxy-4-carboxy-5-ureidoimidazoline decarboxylase